MFRLPESPRRRRRLFWLSVVALVVASATTVIVVLPKGHAIPERSSNEAAQVAESGHTRLSPADRRAIDATLDRFLVAALDRRDPGNWLRYRRARKAFATDRNQAMPSLPAGVRKSSSTGRFE